MGYKKYQLHEKRENYTMDVISLLIVPDRKFWRCENV